jgi:hypothetical protein
VPNKKVPAEISVVVAAMRVGWIVLAIVVGCSCTLDDVGETSTGPTDDNVNTKTTTVSTTVAIHRHINAFKSANCGHRGTAPTREAAKNTRRAPSGFQHVRAQAKLKPEKLAASCSWREEHTVVGSKTQRKLVFSSRVCKGKLQVERALIHSDGKPEGDKVVILSETLAPGQCVTPASTMLPKMREACRSVKFRCSELAKLESSTASMGHSSSTAKRKGDDLIVGDALGVRAKTSSSSSKPTPAPPCRTDSFKVTNCVGTTLESSGQLDTWYLWESPSIELRCYKGNVCRRNGHNRDYCTAGRHFPGLKLNHNEKIDMEFKVSCPKTCGSSSCSVYIRGTPWKNGVLNGQSVPMAGVNPMAWNGCMNPWAYPGPLSTIFSETKDAIHNSCSPPCSRYC